MGRYEFVTLKASFSVDMSTGCARMIGGAMLNVGGTAYEGISFYVLNSQDPGTVPMYRCYIPGLSDHFTSLSSTCEGQIYESVYGYIYDRNLPQPGGTVPVYRCYGNSDHLTTVNYPECELGGYVVEHMQGFVFGP
jgi:hypothetical protein